MIKDKTVLGLLHSFLKPALQCTNCSCRKECKIFTESSPGTRKKTREILKNMQKTSYLYNGMSTDDVRNIPKACVKARLERLLKLCSIKEEIRID